MRACASTEHLLVLNYGQCTIITGNLIIGRGPFSLSISNLMPVII